MQLPASLNCILNLKLLAPVVKTDRVDLKLDLMDSLGIDSTAPYLDLVTLTTSPPKHQRFFVALADTGLRCPLVLLALVDPSRFGVGSEGVAEIGELESVVAVETMLGYTEHSGNIECEDVDLVVLFKKVVKFNVSFLLRTQIDPSD